MLISEHNFPLTSYNYSLIFCKRSHQTSSQSFCTSTFNDGRWLQIQWFVEVSTTPYTLSSPNYPKNYPNNQFCEWILYHPSSSKEYFLVFSDFRTSSCGFYSSYSSNCDYVKIINQSTEITQTISGSKSSLPFTYVLRGKTIVQFISNGVSAYRGFNATVYVCGGTINATVKPQEITLPPISSSSSISFTCVWDLQPNGLESFTLTVHKLNLRASVESIKVSHPGRPDINLPSSEDDLPIYIIATKNMTVKYTRTSGSYYSSDQRFQATISGASNRKTHPSKFQLYVIVVLLMISQRIFAS